MYLDRAKEYCESSDPPEVCDWVDNINDARRRLYFIPLFPLEGLYGRDGTIQQSVRKGFPEMYPDISAIGNIWEEDFL